MGKKRKDARRGLRQPGSGRAAPPAPLLAAFDSIHLRTHGCKKQARAPFLTGKSLQIYMCKSILYSIHGLQL